MKRLGLPWRLRPTAVRGELDRPSGRGSADSSEATEETA